MAFDPKTMTKIANLMTLGDPTAETPSYFLCNTTDTGAVATAGGYAKFLIAGAVIMIVASDGYRMAKVTGVSKAGVVTFTVLLEAVS